MTALDLDRIARVRRHRVVACTVSGLVALAGCGASSWEAEEAESRSRQECHTIIRAEFIEAHVSSVGDETPALLIETGRVVHDVVERAPIEGEVQVRRDRDVVVARADEPTRTESIQLCPFGHADFSDAGRAEREHEVRLTELGGTLHVRCVFGVGISECH